MTFYTLSEENVDSKYLALLVLSSSLLILVGCSGAPSEGEISKAIKSQTEKEARTLNNLPFGMGASMQVKVNEVKKIGCKEDGENAYKCDIELEVEQQGKTSKAPMSARFVKGSDGWMVSGR